jgi:hypothetical protein
LIWSGELSKHQMSTPPALETRFARFFSSTVSAAFSSADFYYAILLHNACKGRVGSAPHEVETISDMNAAPQTGSRLTFELDIVWINSDPYYRHATILICFRRSGGNVTGGSEPSMLQSDPDIYLRLRKSILSGC